METNTHIIKKEMLHIAAASTRQAEELKVRVQKLLATRLNELLDAKLKENGLWDKWVTVDRLTIELTVDGNQEDWEERFVTLFWKKLAAQLPNSVYATKEIETKDIEAAKKSTVQTTQEHLIKSWIYFLRFGWIPWWAPVEKWDAFEKKLEAVITSGQSWKGQLLYLLKAQPGCLIRLASQFSAAFHEHLMGKMVASEQSQILKAVQDFAVSLEMSEHYEPDYWTALYEMAVLPGMAPREITLERLAKAILEKDGLNYSQFSGGIPPSPILPSVDVLKVLVYPLVEKMLQHTSAQSKKTTEKWVVWLEGYSKKYRIPLPDHITKLIHQYYQQKMDIETEQVYERQEKSESKTKKQNNDPTVHEKAEDNKEGDITSDIRKVDSGKGEANALNDNSVPSKEEEYKIVDTPSDNKDLRTDDARSRFHSYQDYLEVKTEDINTEYGINTSYKTDIPEQDEQLMELTDGVFADHAGLVLIHPYLSRFFANSGYTKDGQFISKVTQARAIHMLYYLANADSKAPEYQLLIPKVICGWPLETPMGAAPEFDESELQEAASLLQAVIDNWPALDKASEEALQEGFLQRSGKLSFQKDKWQLQIEQKGQDILLARLPWSVSVIKFPWLELPIMVEWA